ncbi:zinc finger protein RFP [Pogona vitticeps]
MASLHDETTCPICLEYLADPVTTDCGHNFCHACITQCCGEEAGGGGEAKCPQCRETVGAGSLRPNRTLANIVAIAKRFQEGEPGEGEWRVCARHREPQKLFCKDDENPICVVCDRSKEHREHTVFPIEEVAQEYKEKIRSHLKFLKKEKEKREHQKLTKQQEMEEHLNHLKREKDKIASIFEDLQKFLEAKKQFQLKQLRELKKEMEQRSRENLSKISEKISQLSQRIAELEEKCQQPPSVYLQDIRSTLSRYEKNPMEHVVDPSLEDKFRAYLEKNSSFTRVMEDCQKSLEQALNTASWEQTFNTDSEKKALNQVSVTLDRDTAHPRLFISEGLKNLRWDRVAQDLPYNPERFKKQPCVLGREIFTSGKHCWEVEILGGGMEGDLSGEPAWAVGVAKHSVKRKEYFRLNPNEGIWAIGKACEDLPSPCQISVFRAEPSTLTLEKVLQKIRVKLSYEEGLVEFLDADTDESISSFNLGSFSGEIIRPFFYTRGWEYNLKC